MPDPDHHQPPRPRRQNAAELEAKSRARTLDDRLAQIRSLLNETAQGMSERVKALDRLIAARLETFDDELRELFDGAGPPSSGTPLRLAKPEADPDRPEPGALERD